MGCADPGDPRCVRADGHGQRPGQAYAGIAFRQAPRDRRRADLHRARRRSRHWGLLAIWDSENAAAAFEHSGTVRGWGRLATDRLRLTLRPLTSRGTWAGQQPFGDPTPQRHDGPVAAITRARIRTAKALTFWRSVPPVSADLHRSPGLRLAVGIGEAPIGLQGTFSLWDSAAALTKFAHRRTPHVEAVRRTAEVGWYTEELFARFAVLDVEGTLAGRAP